MKAPITLRSETRAEHKRVAGSETYSFCESVTATRNHWHIRKLDETGRHLGGGVTTPSLCGLVRPSPEGLGGWDLSVDITQHHGSHNCQECWGILQTEIAKEEN